MRRQRVFPAPGLPSSALRAFAAARAWPVRKKRNRWGQSRAKRGRGSNPSNARTRQSPSGASCAGVCRVAPCRPAQKEELRREKKRRPAPRPPPSRLVRRSPLASGSLRALRVPSSHRSSARCPGSWRFWLRLRRVSSRPRLAHCSRGGRGAPRQFRTYVGAAPNPRKKKARQDPQQPSSVAAVRGRLQHDGGREEKPPRPPSCAIVPAGHRKRSFFSFP